MTFILSLPARRIALLTGGIAVAISALSIGLKALEYAAGAQNTYWLYQASELFNVNREGNLPAWYSSALLLACAGVIALIARQARARGARFARHWTGLALIFGLLSLDETAAIHERLTIPLQESTGATGYLYFAWVIVGAALVIAAGLAYLRFVLALPAPTRRLAILAGLLYVGGALGIEAISANRWYLDDGTSLTFSAIGTLEELCEMLGAVTLLYAMLGHLARTLGAVRLEVRLPGIEAKPSPPGE